MKMKTMQAALAVSIFKEGDKFVAFAPGLDLATSAATITEVKKNFSEIVRIFFKETERTRTTEEVLSSLGWERQNNRMVPPVEVAHTTENIAVPV